MRSIQRLFIVTTILTVAGCAEQLNSPDVAVIKQAVSVVDCGGQFAKCTLATRKPSELVACSEGFATCNVKAVDDLQATADVLVDCRADSEACIRGAASLSSIRACRDLYNSCAADALDAAGDAVDAAVATVEDAINDLATTAIDTINSGLGAVSDGVTLVNACRKASGGCLTAATSVADALACQTAFEQCADDASDLANDLTAPLPGPTPAEVVGAVDACTADSDKCVADAVTAADINACRATLRGCVDAATGVAPGGLLPLPLPTPVEVIDCNTDLAQCMLTSLKTLDCINQANACLDLI